MARTKKQTLENASERKRLIQEEILRESLAASQSKQRNDGSDGGGGGSSQPSAAASTPAARSRSKGKNRSRAGPLSPNGVASPRSSATAGLSSSRRKAEQLSRGSSKKRDTAHAESSSSRRLSPISMSSTGKSASAVATQSDKGDMPKAVLCIPDIRRSSRSPDGEHGSRNNSPVGADKNSQTLVSEVGDDDGAPVSSRGSAAGRKQSPGRDDRGKHKLKRKVEHNVEASLKSLKAASEMVREEKKRTSRQRSPGSSKEESPESQNPSPERRSSRRQSPSNSGESSQQQTTGERKKTRRKSPKDERPKINIFTDNIGVELGKRIRSPRRLSEDMIALPIFSARRWSSSPRETSYIADKPDGEAASAKSSPEDKDSFKPPQAVSPVSSAKGLSSGVARKKPSPSSKGNSPSTPPAEDGAEEDNITPVRKARGSKIRSRLQLSAELEADMTLGEGEGRQKVLRTKRACADHSLAGKEEWQRREELEEDEDSDQRKSGGLRKGSDKKKKASEKERRSRKDRHDLRKADRETNGDLLAVDVLKGDDCDNIGMSKLDNGSEDPPASDCIASAESKVSDSEKSVKELGLKAAKSVRVKSLSEPDPKPERIETAASVQPEKQPKSDLSLTRDPELQCDAALKSDMPSQEPLDKVARLKGEESKKDDSPQKAVKKKSKMKSLVRANSGEVKKKQKMKIVDEVLSSICKDIMSGVVITPGSSRKSLMSNSEPNRPENREAGNPPEGQCASPISFLAAGQQGPLKSMGELTRKDSGAPPSARGLLQPARNILLATTTAGAASPTSSIVTSSTLLTVASPFTAVSPLTAVSSSCTTTPSSSPYSSVSVSTPRPLSSAKPPVPAFGNQTLKTIVSSSALKTLIRSSEPGLARVNLTESDKPNVAELLTEPTCSGALPAITVAPACSVRNETPVDGKQKPETVETSSYDKLKCASVSHSGKESTNPETVSGLVEKSKVDTLPGPVIGRLSGGSSQYAPQPRTEEGGSSRAALSSVAATNPPHCSPPRTSQATSVIDSCPKVVASCGTQPSSKEASQSSLLCAMLVGGSEVAHTYEKSKPAAAVSVPSTPEIIGSVDQLAVSSFQRQHSGEACTNPSSSESFSQQDHVSTENQTNPCENVEANSLDGLKNEDCELVSEKGDAPISDTLDTKVETESVDGSECFQEDSKKLVKSAAKKNLKIDIASKLRVLNENVLKLLDIDVEEVFLDVKPFECKDIKHEIRTELSLVREDPEGIAKDSNSPCKPCDSIEPHGKDAQVAKEEGVSETALKLEPGEMGVESPLFGVISNLASRLKSGCGYTSPTSIDEMVSSCPKHMVKICEGIDEAARMNELQQRLKEEILKESRKLSVVSGDRLSPSCKQVESSVPSTPVSIPGETLELRENHLASDTTKLEDPSLAEVTPGVGERGGGVSPHMTSSSSTNNSLCDLDLDAMTSAVKDAVPMDVSAEDPSLENAEPKLRQIKTELAAQTDREAGSLEEESPGKRLIHKSKTFDFLDPATPKSLPGTLRRVNSSPQLCDKSPPLPGASSSCSSGPSLESSKNKENLQVKSKLGSKIPVPGTSYVSKPVKKTWRTPRTILQPKPLTVLSELEESSASEKNIFTCANLQKYLNVPSHRVIVPPHKKKEMEVLDERARREEMERANRMEERSDKERAEELINLEYLKYEPDFDEVDGELFMSFSSEAELTAHARVERALQWDKDGTMLRISQAKAFEEAKALRCGGGGARAMEGVKFKHLRGQHMRWKKYRRLYSSEVRSILQGAPSSVEEHLRREASSRSSSRKTSDISKIKGWRKKGLSMRQQLEIRRQKAREWRRARKEGKSAMPPPPAPPPPPSLGLHEANIQQQELYATNLYHQRESFSSTSRGASVFPAEPEFEGSSAMGVSGGSETPVTSRSKRRTGFSHQKEHKQLFRELNMDWEDRMIHRKLGGWSLKGNRPKAFSQAAHKRESKQKKLLGEEGASPLVDIGTPEGVDARSSDTSGTPSQSGSAVDISSPPGDEAEPSKRKKQMKMVYPLLTERMVRSALKVLVDMGHGGGRGGGGGSRRVGAGRNSSSRYDDVDGAAAGVATMSGDAVGDAGGGGGGRRSHGRKRARMQDGLPSLRPILPRPADSSVSPVVLIDASPLGIPPLSSASSTSFCETREGDGSGPAPACSSSSLASVAGSPAVSNLGKTDSIPTSSSLAANPALSAPSSPTPPVSQLGWGDETPSALDTREEMALEGVDTAAEVVSSPSIADSTSSKSCGKPGCRYGCICHVFSVSEAAAPPASPVAKRLASVCDKEYCRLGCICDSLDPEKPIPDPPHCGKPSCMLGCVCLPKEGGRGAGGGSVYSVTEKMRRRRSRKGRTGIKEVNDGCGSDSDIPYLPSMKRRPKTGERFSNLPQREKTHRSAKNLDAITRKALMLYETSEIYCKKTERPPKREHKDLAVGLSGVPLDTMDEDFSFSTATPEIEIVHDSLPEDDAPLYGEEEEDIGAQSIPGYPHPVKEEISARTHPYFVGISQEEDASAQSYASQQAASTTVRSRRNPFDTVPLVMDEERQTVPVDHEPSAHRRKRKSHPLSSEIFTLSTCARTQPYKRKSVQEGGGERLAVSSATSSILESASVRSGHIYSNPLSGSGEGGAPGGQTSRRSAVPSASASFMSSALSAQPVILSGQSQMSSQGAAHTPRTGYVDGGGEAISRSQQRHQQPWHTSMVCLKARGPPPAPKPITIGDKEGEEEEAEVQEEDEVKLLEFAANCNWEGARKEILGRVAQCLMRGQYPQPRTMNICEFLVEILPKAAKPSVIPEELRKKLPGKMYSIRVRITRREVLPRQPTEMDSQVIDLSEGSPMKSPGAARTSGDCSAAAPCPPQVHTERPGLPQASSPVYNQRPLAVSGVPTVGLNRASSPKYLPPTTNVGISGLSRMCVSSRVAPGSMNDVKANGNSNSSSGDQLRSASAPSSRRASTEVSVAVPHSVLLVSEHGSSTTPTLAQVRSKGASLQATLSSPGLEHRSDAANVNNGDCVPISLSSAPATTPGSTDVTTSPSVLSVTTTAAARSLLGQKSSLLLRTPPTTAAGTGASKSVSLLTSTALASSAGVTTPTSGIVPLLCSISSELKYMKIQGKDSLVKVIGMDRSKKILTVPLPVSQKLAEAKQVSSKAGSVPIMAVPVCGPSGTKIVPIMASGLPAHMKPGPGGGVATSTTGAGAPHQFLVRLPMSSQGLPLVKGQVLLRPVTPQTGSGGKAHHPMLIPLSSKSLLTTAKTTSASPSTPSVTGQKQTPSATAAAASSKLKGSTSSDEVIMAFDAAHLKPKVSKKTANSDAQQNSSATGGEENSDLFPTTQVTSSLGGPIMSSEESPKLSDSLDVEEALGKSAGVSKGGSVKEDKSEEDVVVTHAGGKTLEQPEAAQDTSGEDAQAVQDKPPAGSAQGNSEKTSRGQNVYVPNTQQCSSSPQQIIVYPPYRELALLKAPKPPAPAVVPASRHSYARALPPRNVPPSPKTSGTASPETPKALCSPPSEAPLASVELGGLSAPSARPSPTSPALTISDNTTATSALSPGDPSVLTISDTSASSSTLSLAAASAPTNPDASASSSTLSAASTASLVTPTSVPSSSLSSSSIELEAIADKAPNSSSPALATAAAAASVSQSQPQPPSSSSSSLEKKRPKASLTSLTSYQEQLAQRASAHIQRLNRGSKRKQTFPPACSQEDPLDPSVSKRHHGTIVTDPAVRLPPVDEEQDSNSSLSTSAVAGQSGARHTPTTTAGFPTDRPISSLSASLSTTSSDNLMVMLSSDESEIDVGEADNPESIMAIREVAERALENDHGYQRGYHRMISSGSTSPVSIGDKPSESTSEEAKSGGKGKGAEHNMRERKRRSELKQLFSNLQDSVCMASGGKVDPQLSRNKILQEARSAILMLEKRDREAQRRIRKEEMRKAQLLRSQAILRELLMKTMSPSAIQAIAERAVHEYRRRASVIASHHVSGDYCLPHHQKQQARQNRARVSKPGPSSSQHSNAGNASQAGADPTATATGQDRELVLVQGSSGEISLAGALRQTNPRDSYPGSDFPSLYGGDVDASAAAAVKREASSPSPAVNAAAAGFIPRQGPAASHPAQSGAAAEDMVDLISDSSGPDEDKGSVDADQGSPLPTRYEDISECEEEGGSRSRGPTEPSGSASAPGVSTPATSLSPPPPPPQQQVGYEDISDVEEARPPTYEDISDSEEAVVIA